jgi:hypothetical protein
VGFQRDTEFSAASDVSAALSAQGRCQPGFDEGQNHVGLHGLQVVETVEDVDGPPERLEFAVVTAQRAGNAHVGVVPAFAVVDFIPRTGEAHPRTREAALGIPVVESVQRLVGVS